MRSTLSYCQLDELWDMHQKVTAMLTAKIKAQKKVLEHRLVQVNAQLRVK